MSLPPTDIGTTDAAATAPGSPRPSLDILQELTELRDRNSLRARNLALVERAKAAAVARADKAERAERQIGVDRDRWKALAHQHESALRSLAPTRKARP